MSKGRGGIVEGKKLSFKPSQCGRCNSRSGGKRGRGKKGARSYRVLPGVNRRREKVGGYTIN